MTDRRRMGGGWVPSALAILALIMGLAADAPPRRPKLPGELELKLRERKPTADGSDRVVIQERAVRWPVAKTAIIVCDMWDGHYCESAAQRVKVMAPRMNAVLTAARAHGVQIIHAPSGTMHMYEGTPHRERIKLAPAARPPVPILPWCDLDPAAEPPLPVTVKPCSCDDPVVGPEVQKYTRQHPLLDILGYDAVSDSGAEIYNFLTAEGIDHVVIMGVHTNMCVLGRSFGIRQMVRLGKSVALARDLTDAMYDPRQPPYVSHARGTELVIEHIERHWCPSIEGIDLTQVVPGTAGPSTDRAGSESNPARNQ